MVALPGTYVTPAGSTSLTARPVSNSVPLLVTCTEYVIVSAICTVEPLAGLALFTTLVDRGRLGDLGELLPDERQDDDLGEHDREDHCEAHQLPTLERAATRVRAALPSTGRDVLAHRFLGYSGRAGRA